MLSGRRHLPRSRERGHGPGPLLRHARGVRRLRLEGPPRR